MITCGTININVKHFCTFNVLLLTFLTCPS